jgi:hypothetical protein
MIVVCCVRIEGTGRGSLEMHCIVLQRVFDICHFCDREIGDSSLICMEAGIYDV